MSNSERRPTHPTEPYPASGRPEQPAADLRGRSTKWWVGIVLLAVSPLLAIAALFGWLWLSGTPIMDEWECGDGEAPVLVEDGGSYCAEEGAQLEPGEHWDPLGNRPFICEDRWGWTEVEPIAPGPGDQGTECVPDDQPVPDGYRRVD